MLRRISSLHQDFSRILVNINVISIQILLCVGIDQHWDSFYNAGFITLTINKKIYTKYIHPLKSAEPQVSTAL